MLHTTNKTPLHIEKLLGVKINYVQLDEALTRVDKWLQKRGKHYIVTPNPEMLVDAQSDIEFKKALNEANLAIPDSPRLGWGTKVNESKAGIFKLVYLPFLLFPQYFSGKEYPTTTGTDLTKELIKLSEEKGYTTAFLGSTNKVADKLFNCLKADYPKLKIAFCSGNIKVNEKGESTFDIKKTDMTKSKEIKVAKKLDVRSEKPSSHLQHPISHSFNPHTLSQKVDILFLAFGHKKQEKWMNKNLGKLNARIMVGVGGAFDYISGSVPRAPMILRRLGLEWIFRLIFQPWRIRRFWKLGYFVYKVMTVKS